MLTYRTIFLRFLLVFLAFDAPQGYGQNAWDVFDYWPHRPDPSAALYQRIMGRAFEQLDARAHVVASLGEDRNSWIDYQKKLIEKLTLMLVPEFEKSDLKPIITGRIDRPDFMVEKLIFESLPGYPVSAAIFIPKVRANPAPTILFCSGHSDEGFRSSVYQHMILNYVIKGFIVLAFDPVGQGERNQYFVDSGQKKYRPTHEHSYVGNQIFLTGKSPAQYFVWDAIRALDYLETRPEVDKNRIGVTGRSGGGTQSAYLMAVDERIKVAAPECYLTTFRQLLLSGGPQDAEQNPLHFLSNGLDLADLVEARAPKPTLMVTTTRDIFSIQGARDLYREAQQAYRAHGKIENFLMVEDDAPHQSTRKNREATYQFFQKHLNNPGDSLDREVEIFPEKDLWVTFSGQLINEGYEQTLFSINEGQSDQILSEIHERDTPQYLEALPDKIKSVSGYEISGDFSVVFSGATDHGYYSQKKYLVRTSHNYHIPLIWLRPSRVSGKTILVVDDRGKAAHMDSTDLVFQLVRSGHQVILPDLSGYGEMGPRFAGDAFIDQVPLNIWYAGALTKRYPVTIRAEELYILNQFIRQEARQDTEPIAIGFGPASTDLLLAGALGVTYEALFLSNPLISLKSLMFEKNYQVKFIPSMIPGMLPLFDFSDLMKIIPYKITVINPVLPNGMSADSVEASMNYQGLQTNVELIIDRQLDNIGQIILQKIQ